MSSAMRYGVRPIGSTLTSDAVMLELVWISVTAGGLTPSTDTDSTTATTDNLASAETEPPSGTAAVSSIGIMLSFAMRIVYGPGGRVGTT